VFITLKGKPVGRTLMMIFNQIFTTEQSEMFLNLITKL